MKILKLKQEQQLFKTPWSLARKRTVSTERPPLVGEVSANNINKLVFQSN
jgi:hypothetical protein